MPNPIDLQKSLSGANYPATKSDLLECAKSNGADQNLIEDLKQLPDEEYSGPDQVQKAMF
ncbi:DUF2795 domain-containing protein [Mycobacterium sp. URHB0044]|uniref:DUF2795 domain-containing protein n=1 Tax=Mycobacterium sp. URHB0044 TaxID=1380386 RepID=UPI00048ED502|nr:DUF2795 domain-containing protein [Mycobacterium sp. URHB0044]